MQANPRLNAAQEIQLHNFLMACGYERVEDIRKNYDQIKVFIDQNRQSYQRLNVQTLEIVSDGTTNGIVVKLKNIRTFRINNFANWGYNINDNFTPDINGVNPEWLIIDTKHNLTKKFNRWWLRERKKVSLKNNINVVDFLKNFRNATHFEFQTVRRISLDQILDNMPNLVHLKLRGDSKITCSDDNFFQLAREFHGFEYLEMKLTRKSRATLRGLADYLKNVDCINEATFKFSNLNGSRKIFEKMIKKDRSFHAMVKENVNYILNRTDGIKLHVYMEFHKETP